MGLKAIVLVLAAFLSVQAIMMAAHAVKAASAPCALPWDIKCTLPVGAHQDPDVAYANDVITHDENAALAEIKSSPPKDLYHKLTLLGKVEINDRNISVNRDGACTSCHLPYAGFTGGVSLYNNTIVAQPGSVGITNAGDHHPNWRTGPRKPQSYGYAPFMQVLHYSPQTSDFTGGNFWDMRATGQRLGNPAAEQAEGPPVNPLELAMPDTACVVYRISTGPYREFFEDVWGPQAFAITWPSDVESVCNTPGGMVSDQTMSSAIPNPGLNPIVLKLSDRDRGLANATYDQFAEAIAAYEASPEVSPFSSKFDAYLANKVRLTPQEQRGFDLFNGIAKCNTCHSDGIGNTSAEGRLVTITRGRINLASSSAPLFTNQTSANLGVPKNPSIPYLYENVPDQTGYVANKKGPAFQDTGVADFLTSPNNPNPAEWGPLAHKFDGKFQVPTLRNVDKRPRPDFVKAYMHNGYFKSLKEVVHFYNTRDTLPRCSAGSSGEKKTCWPAPEDSHNLNKVIGKLGLSNAQEDELVAFLKTLTDGYAP